MSSVYEAEPPTTGRVVVETNYGALEVELWCREAPLACRNFIQLCLEGYYEHTAFHRLVPGFVLQGGDPTGSGAGGESVYGRAFAPEYHTRLKYTRRGLLGVAAMNERGEGQSQFFLTLHETPELYRRATLFGKIVGDTIYNLVRMGELEVDRATERISFPPTITATRVLLNPFDDIVPRELYEVQQRRLLARAGAGAGAGAGTGTGVARAAPAIPAARNKKTLSFGDEEDGDGDNAAAARLRVRIRSSHEVLDDPALSKRAATLASIAERAPPATLAPTTLSIGTLPAASTAAAESAALKEARALRSGGIADLQDRIAAVQGDIVRMRHAASSAGASAADAPKSKAAARVESLAQLLGVKKAPPQPSGLLPEQTRAYKERSRVVFGKRHQTVLGEMDTLLALNHFREKLRTLDTNDPVAIAHSKADIAPAPRLDICKLHGLADCHSCRDTFGVREEGASEEGWLMHRLVFDKNAGYLQAKHDLDHLQVIDPRARQDQFKK